MPTTEPVRDDPGWARELLDDASVLRGRALPPSVKAFGELRHGPHGSLAGALCVTERELPQLRTATLPLHLAVTGGAGSLEAALRWVASQETGRVTLRRVSARLRGEESPGRNAQRVVAVLDSVPPPADVELAVAPPDPGGALSPAWLAALDELALREVGLLLPAVAPWTADAVDAALDRELPVTFEADRPEDVVPALTTVRAVFDGAPPEPGWLETDAGPRTRRWARAVLVPDAADAAHHLAASS